MVEWLPLRSSFIIWALRMKHLAWIAAVVVVGGLGYWTWQAVPPTQVPEVQLDPTRERPQGGVFAGAFQEPADLSPFTTRDVVARRYVLRFTHDALMELDPVTGDLRPALAVTMKPAADGRSAVFALREGVRFSDGTPLSMQDVLFTWQAASDPALRLGALAEATDLIESVEALDERRLRVTLKAASARSLGIVATGYLVTSR